MSVSDTRCPASAGPPTGATGCPATLAQITTFGVGGSIARYEGCGTATELIDVVQAADSAGDALLFLGGGSNLLASDAPFDGIVVRDQRRDPETRADGDVVSVTVPAGHPWDDLAATAVAQGWSGIEALSGIPGSVGATPVQNVGAYGQEVAETIASVRVWDRELQRVRHLGPGDLRFGYRTSALKESMLSGSWGPTPAYVVLEVTFRFRLSQDSGPVRYAELANRLGVSIGARAPAARVREAVMELRRGKGMVLDPADPDTASAGSFFTNPLLAAERAAQLLPADAPRFDAGSGLVKTSAAWLISRAGFARGHGLPGPAALSTKHVLAITNRGTATATDLVNLAREVRDGVRDRFGVELVPEPVLLGVRL